MASPQFSIRIPPKLDEKLKAYAANHHTTKTDVMISALARYLHYDDQVPLSQRVVELEQRVAALEIFVGAKDS